MEFIPVDSSSLQAFHYDADSKVFSVKYKNGAIYQYHDVPHSVHYAFLDAKSKGKYLGTEIKGKFRHTKHP